MPQPIVVGFDGSDHGFDALALGRALVRTLETRLLVVVAYTPQEWLWAPGTAQPMSDEERETVADQARTALADVDCEVRTVPSPSAAGALHAEAEREGAQMVVVGATHHGTVGRTLLGTVTQEVLDAAPCAVAVAPPGLRSTAPDGFVHVGVGFDDTPSAHDALAVAASLARRAGGDLHVIWAAHLAARALPYAFTGYLNPKYFEEVRSDVEERLERAVEPLRERVAVRGQIVGGATTAALAKQSEHLDLLVIGSRGYGPVRRVLLGSISRAVLAEARCPVLVLPRAARALENERAVGRSATGAIA